MEKNRNSTQSTCKAMLVDDNEDILRTTKLTLEQWNFWVDEFTSPIKALKQFKKESSSYVLLLTDVKMPEMSGIELAMEIRKIRPEIAILFMTAFDTQQEIMKSLPKSQPNDILRKPFQSRQLRERIDHNVKKETSARTGKVQLDQT